MLLGGSFSKMEINSFLCFGRVAAGSMMVCFPNIHALVLVAGGRVGLGTAMCSRRGRMVVRFMATE